MAGQTFPYRNTEGKHPSDVREWLESRDKKYGYDDIDAVRQEDSPRNRAVLALARFDAEYTGIHWDSLPWRDDLFGSGCQSWYVMHAITRVDYLTDSGWLFLPEGE
jgi:hypothetical protein